MPEYVIDPSCLEVQAQVLPYLETHRLTVVCGLVAVTGEIALVQGHKSAREEEELRGLKLPQGGVDTHELTMENGMAAAAVREIGEEVGVSSEHITRVVGVPTRDVMVGGRSGRGGKEAKVYGIVCCVLGDRPELVPQPEEIAVAKWLTPADADNIFRGQEGISTLGNRGKRSRRMLRAIGDAGLITLPYQHPPAA